MSLVTVTRDINQVLANVPGLRVAESITPGTPPDTALAILTLESVQFDSTFARGSDAVQFDLLLVVPTSSPRTQLSALEAILTGVKAEVETLSLPLRVEQAAGFANYSINGVEMYGCHVTIAVTAIA